jgi:TolB-like protein
MFTDIVGYSAMMGKDESKTHELLHKNRDIHQTLIRKYNGTLLKEIGDGIMASFSAATHAVYCAIEIQRACHRENIPLRIGIHQGEVLFEKKDILGDGVNITSRIEQSAEPGCIYISATVYNDIKNKPEIRIEYIGERELKNVDTPQKIYKVEVDGSIIPEWESSIEGKAPKTNWKVIISILISLMAIILIILYIIPKFSGQSPKDIDRSIAVLPFDNESMDDGNEYFVNGMMEDIRNNLAKIGNLRVVSKTSTDQYRNSNKSLKEIASELEVGYILEGTVQKLENQVKIHAQLINAKTDDHVWVDTYQKDLHDVFKVQSEIAMAIAGELYAVITPDELEIIETIPTSSISAYDIFLRARDEHNRYWLNSQNREALENAIVLYRSALDVDSTYARAYTGLARAYLNKHTFDSYFEDIYLDSILVLTNKALSFNNRLDEAYYVRGMYFGYQKEGIDASLRDMNQALEINPNYPEVYRYLSMVYSWEYNDYVKAIENGLKAIELDHSPLLPGSLRNLGNHFSNIGFLDECQTFYDKALLLDNDSITYYTGLSLMIHFSEEDIEEAYKTVLKIYPRASSNFKIVMRLLWYGSLIDYDDESHFYAKKLMEILDSFNMSMINDWHRIAYALWKAGDHEKAEYYFNEQIRWCEESIRLDRFYAGFYGPSSSSIPC